MKVGPEVYLASQLTEITSRFPTHVADLREFLLKEKLPAPSPEAIPDLSSRLAGDARFRADVGSLLRAALYREREKVGYEELLGMLVAAAAGTTHDLKSESEETALREMLRFVAQSRRATFRVDGDEESDAVGAVEPEPEEPVLVGRLQTGPEPVPVREPQAAVRSTKLELKAEEPPVAVAETESRESDDLVLPPFRAAGLFAAQAEVEAPWWRAHPAWIAGVACMLAGIGLGLTLHRVVSAAETHVALRSVRVANSASNNVKPGAPVMGSGTAAASNAPAPQSGSPAISQTSGGITESPVGTVQTASAADHEQAASGTAAPLEGQSTPPSAATGKSSGVPVTVVKQVVTASAGTSDSGDAGGTQMAAATRSIVRQGSAGMTAANVIFSPAPEYPAAAAAARVHGQVTVHAVVDPDGNVIYVHAVSGPALLRDAAEEAVQHWRYSPLLDNGKPIAVSTVAILDFKVVK